MLRRSLGAVLVVALAVLWFTVGPGDPAPDGSSDPTSSTGAQGVRSGTDPVSGLPLVDRDDLPAEARTTLSRIDSGGPFRYSRDGVTFANREGRLPRHDVGYYREYTVPTPGEDDRGARRIVAGERGERYWTADHYDSFARVRP